MALYQIMCKSNEKGIDGESIWVGCEIFQSSRAAVQYAIKHYHVRVEWYIEQIQ